MPTIEQLVQNRPERGVRRKRLPRLATTVGIEKCYEREIRKILKRLKEGVRSILISQLPAVLKEIEEDKKLDSGIDRLASLLRANQGWFNQVLSAVQIKAMVDEIGRSVDTRNKEGLKKMMKAAIGIDYAVDSPFLADQVRLFTESNVGLIQNLGEDLLKDIEQAVTNGVNRGLRASEISQSILGNVDDLDGFRGRFKKAETRARLIARDQVLTLNSNLNKTRQEALGIKKYIWRTSRDDRVRPDHDLDGEIFTYSGRKSESGRVKPRGTLNPGEDINCRCYSEPVIEIN